MKEDSEDDEYEECKNKKSAFHQKRGALDKETFEKWNSYFRQLRN
jgi:hypothetical protein